MGLLAENKSRSRINKDPNNTKWTRDTTTFGQKILRAQGWQPGQYLGVQDAAHSELYTAANASYIRVTLKDDMKGLGFNKAQQDQVTGLDVFSDLLSRLNGKSEDFIEGEKQARLEVKTHRYVEAKWGPMRFVRGGLLVGDDMKEVAVADDGSEADTQSQSVEDKPDKSKKSKKRKAAEVQDSEAESSQDAKKQEKRRRKEERRLAKTSVGSSEGDVPDEEGSSRTKKKSKKDKNRGSVGSEEAGKEEGKEHEDDEDEGRNTKRKSKKEKKEKKEKKKKKTRRNEDEAEAEAETESTTRASSSAATTTGTSTPTTMGTPAPGSRNFVRSRFIAQKRQAVLDTKALAQIFMVKT
ncbi:hypothetical protein E4U43_000088 [Claviceps pusilla]|uniref:PinX1-related protein 1 n=1 Tax=Claviceps pusilla TaxID=123648 RepID=A0A9P7T0D0_9HYPO|nr:hypothetical protein E4U43_000088 [Claviceps pusilla]